MNPEQTENDLMSEVRRAGEGHVEVRRVLLVDDHALFRQTLALICKQDTTLDESAQAGSLAEAHRILSSSNDFALAVIDLDLPEEGGVELIRQLSRNGTPVLALSASRNHERLAGVLGPGEVLTTTASYEDVLGAIRRLVAA